MATPNEKLCYTHQLISSPNSIHTSTLNEIKVRDTTKTTNTIPHHIFENHQNTNYIHQLSLNDPSDVNKFQPDTNSLSISPTSISTSIENRLPATGCTAPTTFEVNIDFKRYHSPDNSDSINLSRLGSPSNPIIIDNCSQENYCSSVAISHETQMLIPTSLDLEFDSGEFLHEPNLNSQLVQALTAESPDASDHKRPQYASSFATSNPAPVSLSIPHSCTDETAESSTQASANDSFIMPQGSPARISSFQNSQPGSPSSPHNTIPCRERKKIIVDSHRPPKLTKDMRQWVSRTNWLLDPFREDEDCWIHPSPPGPRLTAGGNFHPCGNISKRFQWRDREGKHSLVLNYGIVSKLVVHKMTKQQKDGFVNNKWHLSHLCGNWTCLNPAHTTVEAGSVNLSRNNCFSHRSGCLHNPPCLKDRKIALGTDGKLVDQEELFQSTLADEEWDGWRTQDFGDDELQVMGDVDEPESFVSGDTGGAGDNDFSNEIEGNY